MFQFIRRIDLSEDGVPLVSAIDLTVIWNELLPRLFLEPLAVCQLCEDIELMNTEREDIVENLTTTLF